MLTLNDGRTELWQWDTNRKLTVDADCTQVHFSNKLIGRSIDIEVVDGVATIPDMLLQTDKDLTAWAFVGTAENGYTKISKVFKVNRRNKPADYVFTPPEQTTLQELVERLDVIEENQDPDAIKNVVEDYLEQNPVEVPVKSVNGKTGAVKLTAEDVGAISQDDLQEATNEALAQAKASGEFDGADGYTPVKGVDYFDGEDAVSPTIAVSDITGGHRITITDKNGTKTVDVLDGTDGEDGYTPVKGKDYTDGTDGVSPTVSVADITDGHRLTITDANGSKTVDIMDGTDGEDGYTPIKGKDYFDGKNGYTPKKGVDYFTEADKAELVSSVIAALPVYDGEVVAV